MSFVAILLVILLLFWLAAFYKFFVATRRAAYTKKQCYRLYRAEKVMAWFSILVVISIALILALLFWCCEDEDGDRPNTDIPVERADTVNKQFQPRRTSDHRPPYPLLPLHPIPNGSNDAPGTSRDIGFITSDPTVSSTPSAPLQTPPPSYEAATSPAKLFQI